MDTITLSLITSTAGGIAVELGRIGIVKASNWITHRRIKQIFLNNSFGYHIILPAILEDESRAPYVPYYDINVANVVIELIRSNTITKDVKIYLDSEVDIKSSEVNENLVLICGVKRNHVSKEFQNLNKNTKYKLEESSGIWKFINMETQGEFTQHVDDNDQFHDYLRIARYRNPWNHNALVYLIWGLRSFSTAEAAKIIKDKKFLKGFLNKRINNNFDVLIHLIFDSQNGRCISKPHLIN